MNAFQTFLAARAAKAGTPPVANQSAPVSRDEFNTLSRAVAALIEDFDTVASPDKIAAVVNQAFVTATKDMTTNTGGDRGVLVPTEDGGSVRIALPARRAAPVNNAGKRRDHSAFILPDGEDDRAPVANVRHAHLAPKGE